MFKRTREKVGDVVGKFDGRLTRPLSGKLANIFTSPHYMNGAPPKHGTHHILEAYSQMPWLRGAVNRISESVGVTNWQVFVLGDPENDTVRAPNGLQNKSFEGRKAALRKQEQQGDLEELTDHPLLELLEFGNEHLLGQTVFQITQAHLDLAGEAFWILEFNQLGRPRSIWPVPPDWVTELPSQERATYIIQFGGYRFEVPVTRMVMFRDPDPRNPYGRGVGVAESLVDDLEIDKFAARHTKSFFWNSAKPEMIISGDGLQREDTRRLEERWLDQHRGFWDSFKPHFLSRKVEVKELGQTFENMQMTELRKQERDVVVQTFGLPPEKLGQIESCHDEETECLTRSGFKHYSDLSYDDEIATLNPATGKMEYHQPNEIMIFPYNGWLDHWHSQYFDVLVTPEHRLLAKFGTRPRSDLTGGYQLIRSKHFCEQTYGKRHFLAVTNGNSGSVTDVVIPHIANEHGNERSPLPDNGTTWQFEARDFAAFLGYWITEGSARGEDGSSYYVRVSQNPGPSQDRVYEAMLRLGIGEPRTEANGYGYLFLHKSLGKWLKNNAGDNAENKRLPRECFDWPLDAKLELLRALIDGDGHWGSTEDIYDSSTWKEVTFTSVSQQLGNDVQQLAIECGLRTYLRIKETDHKPQYILSVTANKKHYGFTPKLHRHHDKVPYKGKVWCVEVPNGIFITRRNGQIGIHGNSNRASIMAADLFWTKDIVKPRVELIRRTLQQRLVPLFDENIILDFESPIVEDRSHKLNVMQSMPAAFTLNEWRAEAEKQPFQEGGEQVMVQPGVSPVQPEDFNNVNNPDEGNNQGEDGMPQANRLGKKEQKILARMQQKLGRELSTAELRTVLNHDTKQRNQ